MTGATTRELCQLLEQHDIAYWVVGGWGVDALLGRCTRSHKDLDLILASNHNPQAWAVLHDSGYSLAYRWEENVEVADIPTGDVYPTAYALEDRSGRQVDIHVVDDGSATLRPLWITDRSFPPGALDAIGTIDGIRVRCMSAVMQLTAHEGYDLPETHLADVANLRELISGPPA